MNDPHGHRRTERPAPPSGVDEWNERYGRSDQMWSGAPNGALTVETADLVPGRALDVGCGEGADAIWLAGRGWDVDALDVSDVALERARTVADRVGVTVRWIHAGIGETPASAGPFDLVVAMYPALSRTPDRAAESALVAAVAPGGHLLVVHHLLDAAAIDRARSHGFDPEAYVSPRDVFALLDDRWSVEFDERRPRVNAPSGSAHHADDVVLHARRQA